MPKPRYTQVSLEATPYYHCVSRCVRRAFLCGEDAATGQSYEHRRQWIEDKLLNLSEVFALGVCAYAVMSNHYHVVLYVDKEQAEGWTRDEVIDRWHRLFAGHLLSRRYVAGEPLGKAELKMLDKLVETWRARLMDISWFMVALAHPCASRHSSFHGHRAPERVHRPRGQCRGQLHRSDLVAPGVLPPATLAHPCASEGRFKSQALLDEAALAACLAYVDLNPIRAQMAETPEASEHTRIQRRIKDAMNAAIPNHPQQQPKSLMPFAGNPRQEMPKGLPFRLTDYLELVEWTGRAIRKGKCGAIDGALPPILQRLNLDTERWLYLTQHFESRFKTFVGAAYQVKRVCEQLGYQRAPGIKHCESWFP